MSGWWSFFIFVWAAALLEALPEGMRYHYLTRHGPENAPLVIHVLEIDPTKVKILPVHAGKEVLALETVSSIAKRHHAAAAINGGFFRTQKPYAGTSAGILRIGGDWYSSPRLQRAAIGWKQSEDLQDCKAAIDRVSLDMKLFIDKQVLGIDGINQPPAMMSAILYTSHFHPVTLTSSTFSELAIDADGNCHEQPGPTPIPKNGYVYSLSPLASPLMPFLSQNARARIQITIHALNHPDDTGIWSTFPHIVGGSPVLVSDGMPMADFSVERLPDSFTKERHARTAIGINNQGKWLIVVVDGNNQANSIGMTLEELARFMHEIGSFYALNLDGGGSSTLVLEDKVANAPRGMVSKNPNDLQGIEKPVSDAILFFSKNNNE